MNNTRRQICQYAFSALGLSGISACAQPTKQPPQRTYSEQEQQRMHKFRGIRGAERFVSGFGRAWEEGVFATLKNDQGQPIESGYFWAGGDSKSSFPLYSTNMMQNIYVDVYDRRGGKFLYQSVIPVAERIPEELLDDLRRDPKGGLRIKIRLHREGVLLGWDIARRPGFDPKKRDQWGKPLYVAAVHSFAGGDFREADVFNGKAIRKGWYIHPKTGQRIETNF
jgi:hypothetical protein